MRLSEIRKGDIFTETDMGMVEILEALEDPRQVGDVVRLLVKYTEGELIGQEVEFAETPNFPHPWAKLNLRMVKRFQNDS